MVYYIFTWAESGRSLHSQSSSNMSEISGSSQSPYGCSYLSGLPNGPTANVVLTKPKPTPRGTKSSLNASQGRPQLGSPLSSRPQSAPRGTISLSAFSERPQLSSWLTESLSASPVKQQSSRSQSSRSQPVPRAAMPLSDCCSRPQPAPRSSKASSSASFSASFKNYVATSVRFFSTNSACSAVVSLPSANSIVTPCTSTNYSTNFACFAAVSASSSSSTVTPTASSALCLVESSDSAISNSTSATERSGIAIGMPFAAGKSIVAGKPTLRFRFVHPDQFSAKLDTCAEICKGSLSEMNGNENNSLVDKSSVDNRITVQSITV